MALFGRSKTKLIAPHDALPGRSTPQTVPSFHAVFTDRPITPPFPSALRTAVVAMGCFWGPERLFWQTPGVWTTAVGYTAGSTPNPTYEEVCSGRTGHAEAVLVVFDPVVLPYQALLRVFWEGHDPTSGMRQGADVGTQYRSGIYYADEGQRVTAEASRAVYQQALFGSGHGAITTELEPLEEFYYAEDYHQQYLSDAKNPYGYCGLGGTGVSCPAGLNVSGQP
ncbi:peptide-methionine (S)-S-oxide reductase MsrA [Lentzea flava]|uniref:Peptide methionine sulfoxide reductase MsrA n=1 Tax=Lentzea flava TaxID=103732 RepID=A0ABQ2UC98_9PSEU|nr:peptide-methionine (S)-S-oxide reductase MsrA [Lentzea flava]MCP2197659.1 peptide-methionine (S)-S-oxide reductase [Lentzea flava]GGU21261.1 peptide methionine sulfoxide reductase MsrA [Lentzea flava]